MTSWSDRYVGIPYSDFGLNFEAVNCWGLVRLVYQGELGVDLPSYQGDYTSPDEAREVHSLVDGERLSSVWMKVSAADAFDVAVFRRGHLPRHVGIVVDGRHMLHVAAGGQSRLEEYTLGPWRNRLIGVYRHRSRAAV